MHFLLPQMILYCFISMIKIAQIIGISIVSKNWDARKHMM